MSLQAILQYIELEVESVLSLLLALHGDVAILLATSTILSLVSIACCKESYLADVLLLAFLLLSINAGEERICLCVEESTPILQNIVSLVVLSSSLTCINELNTS